MSFKSLLDAWSAEHKPVKTRETYNINLDVDDAAKVHAFAEMFPGVDRERIITDLLSKQPYPTSLATKLFAKTTRATPYTKTSA